MPWGAHADKARARTAVNNLHQEQALLQQIEQTLLVQVRASGELSSLGEIRDVIRKSSDVATCRPAKPGAWEEAAARFAELSAVQ